MSFNNILVLYKESNYKLQLHGRLDLKSDHPILNKLKSFLINEHEHHYRSLDSIKGVLDKHGLKYKICSRGRFVNYEGFDCIITIGGDGTFLEASRYVEHQHIIGINSAPNSSVGKFCFSDAGHFDKNFDLILSGKLEPVKLRKLRGTFSTGGKEIHALNDVLICHQNPAALSRYIIQIGRQKEIQKSSGIWVATPAGSTGAIKSAGGKKMAWDEMSFQYKPRELYQFKKGCYSLKGGIVAGGRKLKITSIMKGAVVYVDGAHVRRAFAYGSCMTIDLSPKSIKAYLKK